MAIRRIITYPDPLLRRMADPVTEYDTDLAELVTDMVETMRHAPGIGLAAPQVGIPRRLIVIELAENEEDPPMLYAICNPEITSRRGKAKIEEGCLSLPGFYIEVDRSREVRVEGQNPDGTRFSLDAEGLLSICFQHEIDHLDGKTLLDHAGARAKKLYREELNKRHKEKGSEKDRRPQL